MFGCLKNAILKQEIDSAKTYAHNLLDVRYVDVMHRFHTAAKFDVFVDETYDKLPSFN